MVTTPPVALITGASRGIGRGIALSLAANGYDIVGTATTENGLGEVKGQVESLGRRFVAAPGDLSDLSTHSDMLEAALGMGGRIDCFVSNAGIAPKVRADLLDMTPESFDQVLGVNLRGAVFFAQAVARHMVGQGNPNGTCLIFITSISAKAASPNRTEYCISKSGLSMAAQSFAVRLAPLGISVYEIQPGIIQTDMTAAVRDKYDGLIAEGLLLTPRWGTSEDIGKAVASLARGDFAYATGAVIEVGGGFGVSRL